MCLPFKIHRADMLTELLRAGIVDKFKKNQSAKDLIAEYRTNARTAGGRVKGIQKAHNRSNQPPARRKWGGFS